MPDATTSHDMPDPAPRASAPPAHVALDSMPRQQTPPAHDGTHGLPLPPPWPAPDPDGTYGPPANGMSVSNGVNGMGSADGVDPSEGTDAEQDFAPRNPDDSATRPLFAPEQWVSDPDFWTSKTHIALTGRHPVPRPKTLPLRPPQRFRPLPRWSSMLVLLVVCVLIVLTIIGVVALGHFGMQVINPPHHLATPVPTHTLTAPTATPPHHKK